MVQNNGDSQSPSGDPEPIILDGARNESLPGVEGDGTTTEGADKKPAERTYSETEVRALQSALDKQVSDQRNISGRLAMELTVEKARGAEGLARNRDAQAVEDGDITQQAADERARQRSKDYQQAVQQEQGKAQLEQAYQRGEESMRLVAAQELATEHGVDFKELLEDRSLDPEGMVLLAERLKFEKEKTEFRAKEKNETFDGGGGGSGAGPGSLEGLSAEAKIAYGLAHPPRGGR